MITEVVVFYCRVYVRYVACSIACNSMRLSLRTNKGNLLSLLTSLSKRVKYIFCYMGQQYYICRQYILSRLPRDNVRPSSLDDAAHDEINVPHGL